MVFRHLKKRHLLFMETIMLSWKFLRPISLVRAPMFLVYFEVYLTFWHVKIPKHASPIIYVSNGKRKIVLKSAILIGWYMSDVCSNSHTVTLYKKQHLRAKIHTFNDVTSDCESVYKSSQLKTKFYNERGPYTVSNDKIKHFVTGTITYLKSRYLMGNSHFL